MVNDVISDPLAVANELRPVLLRLARELRQETEQLGVTSRQVTLLWLIRLNPGLSLRELAAEEGSPLPPSPATSTGSRRPACSSASATKATGAASASPSRMRASGC